MNAAGNAGVHIVARRRHAEQDLASLPQVGDEIAKANNLQPTARLNVGDRLIIPGIAHPR